MKMLVVGTLLAAFAVSPALAQGYGPTPSGQQPSVSSAPQPKGVDRRQGRTRANPLSAYAAVTPFGSPAGAGGPSQMNAAREKAIRECMVESRRYSVNAWGSMEGHQYRTCMAQRGQAE